MSTRSATHRSMDLVEGTGAALVGGGVITMALFPLALPMIALLAALPAIAAIPLLLLAIAAGVLAAAVAAPVMLLRALWRGSVRALSRMRHDRHPSRATGWLTDG